MAKYEAGKITEQSSIKDQASELNRLMDALDGFNPPETYEKAKLSTSSNLVNVEQASPVDFEFQGRTLVNLLRDGGFETHNLSYQDRGIDIGLTNISILYDRFKDGLRSLRSNKNEHGYIGLRDPYKVDASKSYIFGVSLFIDNRPENGTRRSVRASQDNWGTAATKSTEKWVNASDYGNWVDVILPFTNFENVRFLIGSYSGEAQFYAHIDSLRLYEISSQEYTEALTLNDSELAIKYPYVDGVKHINRPVISKIGKNLLPTSIEGWDVGTINSSDGLSSDWNSRIRTREFLPVLPNQSLTISCNSDYVLTVLQYRDGRYLNQTTGWRESGYSFQVLPQANQIRAVMSFRVGNDPIGLEELNKAKAQLEFGSSVTDFQNFNRDYFYLNAALSSNLDGRVKDQVYVHNGEYTLVENMSKGLVIDGSIRMSHFETMTGEKRVKSTRVEDIPNAKSGTVNIYAYIPSLGVTLEPRRLYNQNLVPRVHVHGDADASVSFVLPNSLTGFTDNQTPTSDDWHSFFTQHPMYFYYELRTPKVSVLEYEGAIALHKGVNNIKIDTDVVFKELVSVVRANGDEWYINGGTEVSRTKVNSRDIIKVYLNGKDDTHNWGKVFRSPTSGATSTYGLVYMVHKTKSPDPNGVYTVDYIPLNPLSASPTDIKVRYATTMAAAFNKTVEKLTDAEQRQSVLARQIIQLYARTISGGS